MAKVGIYGASGYTGAELLRLCAAHPDLDVVVATGDTQSGSAVASLYPSLAPAYGDLVFAESSPGAVDGVDLLFLALPHGKAQEVVPQVRDSVGAVVDLSADFRLKDASLYPQWYGEEHHCPELLPEFVYGLPELFRDQLVGSRLVAAPGCYVTAASLALAPLVRAGAIEPTGVIVDAASGVSGAGRGLKHSSLFCTVDEDMTAYGLLDHRHTPEMEQVTGAQILFTPHLVPMNRGILATCYARPAGATSTSDLLGLLHEAYDAEPFVVVSERSPSTKATLGSNSCHLTARFDERTGTVVVLSALDNLTKGASGQAVQCANLVLGLPETSGLPVVGVYP
jgi:N-acetyl-gamma-glutamyl-phosphate reductase